MEYPYSLDDYVEEVKNYILSNNLKKPNLVAHSFGGRIALKLCYKYPNLIDKVVLTGCAGLKPKFSFKKFIKKVCFKFLSVFIDKHKLSFFYSSDYNLLSPVMKKSFIKIVNENLDYTLSKIKNKTLIINGSLDKETPLYMAKKLHKNISSSKLIIIKGAGHFAFIDKPFKFNREVKEFFKN